MSVKYSHIECELMEGEQTIKTVGWVSQRRNPRVVLKSHTKKIRGSIDPPYKATYTRGTASGICEQHHPAGTRRA